MNDPVSDICRQLLLDLSLGTDGSSEWPVFVGILPDQPDNAISCYDTAGIMNGRIMRTGEQVEHPGLQIMVRSPDYLSAINKANAIALALDQQSDVVVQMESNRFYRIQNISRAGAILPLGLNEDDRRRYHFSINAVLTIHPES